MMPKITAVVVLACALFVSGCGNRGPALRGTYLNAKSEAALEVTADEIIVKSNWVRLGVQYKVMDVNGPDMTVQISYPRVSQKGTIAIRVSDDGLLIRGSDAGMFAGTWTRTSF